MAKLLFGPLGKMGLSTCFFVPGENIFSQKVLGSRFNEIIAHRPDDLESPAQEENLSSRQFLESEAPQLPTLVHHTIIVERTVLQSAA